MNNTVCRSCVLTIKTKPTHLCSDTDNATTHLVKANYPVQIRSLTSCRKRTVKFLPPEASCHSRTWNIWAGRDGHLCTLTASKWF